MDEIFEVAQSPAPGVWNSIAGSEIPFVIAVRMVNRGEGTFTHLKTAHGQYVLRFHKYQVPQRPPIIRFPEPL